MSLMIENRPEFTTAAAREVLLKSYGIEARLTPLPAEWDQNFLVHTDGHGAYVLKIANRVHSQGLLEIQNLAMDRLAEGNLSTPTPQVLENSQGRQMTIAHDDRGRDYRVRLLSHVEGVAMAKYAPAADRLLVPLGRALGEVADLLTEIDHPAAARELRWDLRQASWIAANTHHIDRTDVRAAVERWLVQWQGRVVPHFPNLPMSVIHGDANDENVLVAEDTKGILHLSGLIDFGDMVLTHTINDLAVAGGYTLLDREDPVEGLLAITRGYNQVRSLSELELEVLFGLAGLRLCVSVVSSSIDAVIDPGNAHQQVTRHRAMDALLKLDQIHWQEAEERLRTACDLPMRKSRDYGGPTAATELLAQRRECLSPSLSVAYEDPLVILRGSGTFLYDAQGNAHLDCVNNICHVGHSHPAVVNAAARQAELLNTNTRYLHPLLVNYAQRIADLMPDPLQVVFFVNSGTEANELAVRLARTYTGRRDAVVVSDGYHGHSSTLINLSPYKHNGPGGHGPPEWVHTVPAPNPYRGAHQGRTVECGRAYAQYVADVCAHLTALGRGPAFFMAEPILGCGGQVVPPPGWLKNAYAHIRGVGGLCIADEIQVGFGRVGGHMWAFQGQDVVPDIVTLGKPMGNGHPIGAVVTTREIAETFANGMEFFSSFGGNPVSCAVGMAVLDVIEKEGLQAHAHHMGDFLARGFQTLAEQHAAIGDIRGQGLFMGIELVRDPLTREPAREEAAELVKALRRDRILVSLEGPDHNVIKLKPPLPFGETEANLLLAAFDRALSQLL